MNKKLTAILSFFLLYSSFLYSSSFLLSRSAIAAEQILDAEAVTQLFSGNTYEANLPGRGLTMTVYADPDGTMKGMQNGKKFITHWKVNEQGEICVSYRDKTNCRPIVEENGLYKKYKLDEYGNKTILVVYEKFTPGNIHGF